MRGVLPSAQAPMVAIVGSRACTPYGRRVTREICKELARAGIVIVSGLAFGIDAVAHEATLDVHGKTIAVLASAVDNVTPAQNRPLAEQILNQEGAIVSELPTGSQVNKFSFPVRNRLISGMCLATVVVEAAEKSGSLLTARAALEEGRDVFAVPGPIDSDTSKGANALLRSGAHVATGAKDILDLLGIQGIDGLPVSSPPTADSKEEAMILATLSKKPIHVDTIVRESGMPVSKTNTTLTLMEMKGKVRHVGGGHYII